jgi:hypothetical protein
MRHLADGTLRRMVDEPAAIRDPERDHYRSCITCRNRCAAISADADESGQWMAAPAVAVDRGAALARLQQRIHADGLRPPRRWKLGVIFGIVGRGRVARTGMMIAASAAVIAGALAWTPAGSLAQDVITIFQPSQPVAVTVTAGDVQALNQLTKYGTFSMPSGGQVRVVSGPAEAAAASSMTLLTPSSLPADVSPAVTYSIVPGQNASFTFSSAKASAAAAAAGESLPPMPANLDGSTLEVTTSAAVLATYGSRSQDIPNLVIGQMSHPIIRATGVTVQQLEDYLLSLPGISPQLAAEVRAIGDPTSALPIPVPAGGVYSSQVTVQGVKGVAVGDSTGVGSGVVWQKDGIVYGVAGPISKDEVLTIANGLR